MIIFNLVFSILFWKMANYYFEEGMNFMAWSTLFFSAMNAAAFFANVL